MLKSQETSPRSRRLDVNLFIDHVLLFLVAIAVLTWLVVLVLWISNTVWLRLAP